MYLPCLNLSLLPSISNTTDPSKVTNFVANAMKDQFISSMQAGEACAPADGPALRAAIDGTCVAITLAAGE